MLRGAFEANIRMETRVVGVVDDILDPSVRQKDVVLAACHAMEITILLVAKIVAGMEITYAITERILWGVLLQLQRKQRGITIGGLVMYLHRLFSKPISRIQLRGASIRFPASRHTPPTICTFHTQCCNWGIRAHAEKYAMQNALSRLSCTVRTGRDNRKKRRDNCSLSNSQRIRQFCDWKHLHPSLFGEYVAVCYSLKLIWKYWNNCVYFFKKL